MAQDPNSTIDFLKLVPEYVWIMLGVLIAGVLPWIGIYLQLRHDSKEKEKERKMSLRREVYLLAAQKIGQQLSYLSHLHSEETMPEGYNEMVMQIEIIGNNETIRAINEFNEELSKSFWELMPIKHEIKLLQQNIDTTSKLLTGGLIDEKKCLEQVKNLSHQFLKRTGELEVKCQQKVKLCQVLLPPIILAIREELGTPFDETAYRAMMARTSKKLDDSLKKHMESMRRIYDEFIEGEITKLEKAGNSNNQSP